MTAKRDLCVDGHEFKCEPDDEPQWMWVGDKDTPQPERFPPFAIFDVDAQENLQPYYATRAQAEMAMARILDQST